VRSLPVGKKRRVVTESVRSRAASNKIIRPLQGSFREYWMHRGIASYQARNEISRCAISYPIRRRERRGFSSCRSLASNRISTGVQHLERAQSINLQAGVVARAGHFWQLRRIALSAVIVLKRRAEAPPANARNSARDEHAIDHDGASSSLSSLFGLFAAGKNDSVARPATLSPCVNCVVSACKCQEFGENRSAARFTSASCSRDETRGPSAVFPPAIRQRRPPLCITTFRSVSAVESSAFEIGTCIPL